MVLESSGAPQQKRDSLGARPQPDRVFFITMSDSRDIPRPVKREVRRRCGFGCVLCGLPLYQYDHLDGWAETKTHEAERLTLLCDRHHREKTGGLLPNDAVEVANAAPFNLRSGVSTPYDLHFEGDACTIAFGGNTFTKTFSDQEPEAVAVMIDEVPLLAFRKEDGHLLLTLQVCNRLNYPYLIIEDNELVFSTSAWDIELVGTRLVVRAAPSQVVLDMLFLPPNSIQVDRAYLALNGVLAAISPGGVFVPSINLEMGGSDLGRWSHGLVLGVCDDSQGGALVFRAIDRYRDVPAAAPATVIGSGT